MGGIGMIYVGIDVAKNKHDCCILANDGSMIREPFSFSNDRVGFQELDFAVQEALHLDGTAQIKAGLEATGHYSENLVAFLRSSGFKPIVLNPLQVNLYRKSQSLRKTKTDKVDAKCIAQLLMSMQASPAPVLYQIQELKTLTRYRFRLISLRTKLKLSIARSVDILFPELTSACSTPSQPSIRALLLKLPSAKVIANCRIDRLTNILSKASRGRYGRDKAQQIKGLALGSIGTESPAGAFELKQILLQFNFLQSQINELDKIIRDAVTATHTPLLTIPGIGVTLAAIILAEIGDIHRFSSSDKLLAFAGLDPSTYQSGKYSANRTPMVKHGSTYLRWALMRASHSVALCCEPFHSYLGSKLAQGKHYYVALGHTSKKLVRVIFRILSDNEVFVPGVA